MQSHIKNATIIIVTLWAMLTTFSCTLFKHSISPSTNSNDPDGTIIAYNQSNRAGMIMLPIDNSGMMIRDRDSVVSGRVQKVIRSNYDPSQRSSFVAIRNNGSLSFISEVQPDAAIEVSKNFSAAISAAVKNGTSQEEINAAINAANTTAEKVAELGARNPSNFLLRDALYRLNEIVLNGGMDSPKLVEMVTTTTGTGSHTRTVQTSRNTSIISETYKNAVDTIASVAIHEADAAGQKSKADEAIAKFKSDSLRYLTIKDSLGKKLQATLTERDSLKKVADSLQKVAAKKKSSSKADAKKGNGPVTTTTTTTTTTTSSDAADDKKKKGDE